MHFSGLIVALAAGLAAASPITETRAADSCPKWDGLSAIWNGFACCTYITGGRDAVECCRLSAADAHGYYSDSLPCTSEWFSSAKKWLQFDDCNHPEPFYKNCAGVPVMKQ
ncbi:hypothetical protein RB595_007523 [Gaeumannomyces hyphopodioides]